MFTLPISIYLLFLIPGVQTFIANKITKEISQKYNLQIDIDKVYFVPFKRLSITNCLIKTNETDTLLYAPDVNIHISEILFRERRIKIDDITFNNTQLNISKTPQGLNIQTLIDSLSSAPKNSEGFISTELQELGFKNNTITYKEYTDSTKSILQTDLHFTKLNLYLSDINLNKNSKSFTLKHFSFHEKSGIEIKRGKVKASIDSTSIVFEELMLASNESFIDAKLISLTQKNDSAFDNFVNDVNIVSDFKRVHISPNDLVPWKKQLTFLKESFDISGKINGTISNLKGKNISLNYGKNTLIKANFDIKGLPNINDAFLFIDVIKLQTSADDINHYFISNDKELFPGLNQLGLIKYSGNFTGFANDLVAFGKFSTNLGKINTDIGVKIDKNETIFYSGSLKTTSFNLGLLANDSSSLGNITMKMSVNGYKTSSNNYKAKLQGTIDSILINNYQYQNIALNGTFANKQFDGSININDPNGQMDFMGKVNMALKIPSFDFHIDLKNLNLNKLNLNNKIQDGELSLTVQSNFQGKHLDDIVGSIIASHGHFKSAQEEVFLDTLSILAYKEGDHKHIHLISDFADGHLSGKYFLKGFNSTIISQLHNYLPNLFNSQTNTESSNIFDFDLQLKNIGALTRTVFSHSDLANNSSISGSINSDSHKLSLKVQTAYLKVMDNELSDLDFELLTDTIKNELTSITTISNYKYKSALNLKNLILNNRIYNDTIQTKLFWNDWKEVNNSGSLDLLSEFSSNKIEQSRSHFQIQPSTIIIKDSIWNISGSDIYISPQNTAIDEFILSSSNQTFRLTGEISKDSDKKLELFFKELDLSYFSELFNLTNVTFGGILNGNLAIKNAYETPIITSDLEIDNFVFNKDSLGLLTINSEWLNDKKALSVETKLEESDITTLETDGYLFTEDKRVDFNIHFNRFKLGFLNLYLYDILQNLDANISGDLTFSGPLSDAGFSGKAVINDGEFDIDLLNTHYSISDTVEFFPHEMRFHDLTLRDHRNRKGRFYGSIYHTDFMTFAYNLRLNCNNMLVLNTKERDNPLYFGSVYATATMAIQGPEENVNIDISGKTETDSYFFIPLQRTQEAEELGFIRFTRNTDNSIEQSSEVKPEEYVINVSGLSMNMDIEATPDAQVQIIFDPKTGDILRANGNGNIQIKINNDGKVSFYGDYRIAQGDYLFTLQNIINKRFKINDGGTVKWTGDPYNALIDIKATYKLKASLSDLIGSASTGEDASKLGESTRRVPINCNLLLYDQLQKPTIKFEIETPTLEESNKNLIRDYISTEEELNRQVLSLLVLNRFYTPENLRNTDTNTNRTDNTALITTTEVLSNQLSHWLSQISSDFDVNLSYRPEDEISSEEIEVALSTQMLNNRVSLNGNIGYGKNQTTTSNLVGDFDVDVKLNKSGTIRAKAYTKTNDEIIFETSPTTQGVGISYKEEFNTFSELLLKYWNIITGKNKKPEEDNKK